MKKSVETRSLPTFSRVHPRICCQCTRPVASIKPISIQWSMHLWWRCFSNPLYYEMIIRIWEWKQSRHGTPTHTYVRKRVEEHQFRAGWVCVWCWINQLVCVCEHSTLAIFHFSLAPRETERCVAALHGTEAKSIYIWLLK